MTATTQGTNPLQPELSVVIVSYRCSDHLAACLGSLDAQRKDVALEVIVVDNASGDATAPLAANWPLVRLLECSGNSGFARAANQGIVRASGEFVLILNPDTVIPPGVLRACIDEIRSDPSVGILTPRVVDAAGQTDLRCHRSFPTPWSAACFITRLDRVLPARIAGAYLRRDIPDERASDVEAVSGAFMLMPRAALQRVGGFDQQFFMYAEDIDLCMRFGTAGYRVRYWPAVAVTHEGGASTAGASAPHAALAAAHRTMAPLIRKHRPGARGLVLAALAATTGELMLAARRLSGKRRQCEGSPGADDKGDRHGEHGQPGLHAPAR